MLVCIHIFNAKVTVVAVYNKYTRFSLVSNIQHSKTGVTALMTAAGQGHVTVIEQLLVAGADVDLRATNNWTARDFAVCQNQQAVVELLESYK